MKTMLKKIGVVLAVIGAVSFLTACNTVEGVGKDVEATGEAIEDAAD